MADVILTAPRLLTGRDTLSPGWMTLGNGRVTGVGTGAPPQPPTHALDTGLLAPGLVEAQLNGAFGVDFADASDADWARVLRTLPSTGVTAVVPTLITAPVPELAAALQRYAANRPALDALPGAARTLGLHLEGPFLAAARRGAHRAEHLVDPSPEHLDPLLAAADGALAYVTLAPERDGALAAIRRLTAAGVRVAVGHSDATEDQVHAAADAGATLVTHLYNAQSPLGHRAPGVVGAALTDPRLTCGLIADLHHVAPAAVHIAFAAAPGRIMLVSDAVSALGMPPGTYILGGVELTVTPGQPPLRADGTIAGSAVRLDEAVANAVACGVDLKRAVAAATRVPADALGRPDLGRLEPGCAGDVVWLDGDDERGLRARATWVRGELAWSAGALPGRAP